MSHVGPSPISLSLSDDSAIESVLTDIPFFCVGLLTFGVFTFALVLKRVNIIAIYLYMSSFLSFTAGIFDLSHILSRGRATLANGTGRDVNDAFVTTREVLLALSLGFSYVFLWLLVAQCPRNERDLGLPKDTKPDEDKLPPSRYLHSASWRRWGIIGLFLQWSLLVLACSIPILQILWRVSPLNARFGTIYIAESTIEVVVSALFMLKIFLNIYLSPTTPWWRPIQSNVAPLLALAISAGLGLGNLFALVFSETTLGRFLRAVEMYILILFMLITAFYKLTNDPLSSSIDPDKSFMRISEKGTVPIVRPPVLAGLASRRGSILSINGLANRLSIATSFSRFSSWVFPGSRDPTGRIYVEDRELGMASSEETPTVLVEPSAAKADKISKAAVEVDTPLAFDRKKSDEQSTVSKDPPLTATSIPSYYRMEQAYPIDLPPPRFGGADIVLRDIDSPVYGLNGIMASSSSRRGMQSRPHSSISFNELLRQQTELDNSIAALRLFSTEPTNTQVATSQPTGPVSPIVGKNANSPKLRSASMSTVSYLGRRLPDSASNRSDFSLSIFPEPPAAKTEELPLSTKLEQLAGRARSLRREPIIITTMAEEVIDKAKQAGGRSSLPVSPTGYEGGTPRLESAGTQYDVTSFIGGLTLPGRGSSLISAAAASSGPGTTNIPGLATARTVLSDVESVDERSADISAVTTTQAIRPMVLASSTTVGVTGTAELDPKREVMPLRREPSISLRPLLLGTATQNIPVKLPSSTMVPLGSRQQRRGLPASVRRPAISGPSLFPEDGRGDQAPGAFERPRPPPLVLM